MKRKRRIYFDGDVAYVSLANAKGVAKVDTDDVGSVSGAHWSLMANGYAQAKVFGRHMYLHRAIVGSPSPGSVWDHANGDRLDNRRANLRVADRTQNNTNRRSVNSTGYRGVRKNRAKFSAEISVCGARHYLGSFGTPEEAARAYDTAAQKLHQEFATLNFGEE